MRRPIVTKLNAIALSGVSVVLAGSFVGYSALTGASAASVAVEAPAAVAASPVIKPPAPVPSFFRPTSETNRDQERPALDSEVAKTQVADRHKALTTTSRQISTRVKELAKAEAARKKKEAARIREFGYKPGTKDPREIARQMMKNKYDWGESEFKCYNNIIMRESEWKWNADNPTSSAYGIPQALPGRKMASAGPDWRTNPATQIKWGLGYVKDRFGTPCKAWSFKKAHGWY